MTNKSATYTTVNSHYHPSFCGEFDFDFRLQFFENIHIVVCSIRKIILPN